MTELRCTIRRRNGEAASADVLASVEPTLWSADDAKEAPWAVFRLLEAPALYRLSLIEVEPAKSWRIEVHTPTGVALTPALRLSSMAYVWLTEAAFECSENGGVH